MREHAVLKRLAAEAGFHWRGEEITRLEGFSDAVFAFAVTLLVVSLEVPKAFSELIAAMHGFAAFGFSFALLAFLWHSHYRFFRRYGLQDPWAIFLNCVLLFFVVFFVYPLKFLSVAMFQGAAIGAADARMLFAIYGSGFAAVFLVFALLYLHAWSKRDDLELNDIERLRTRRSLFDHAAMVAIGLISILVALSVPENLVGLAGYLYFVMGAYFTVAGSVFRKKEDALQESAAAASALPASESPAIDKESVS
jgi:uncharacterized membrane protein